MSTKRNKILALALLGLALSWNAMSQQSLIKTADHHYEYLSFVKAVAAYELALGKKGISADEAIQIKVKLADSHGKLNDMTSAEEVYNDLFSSGYEIPGLESKVYLKYAQALASNGKYPESQIMYDIYTEKAKDDPRGPGFSNLYNDVSVLSKYASCYAVDYLSINTTAADFSPSYFRNGLVFVSNRSNSVGVRRVFQWSQTPFLDLFYLEDIAALGSNSAAGLGGSTRADNSKKARNKKNGVVGADEYTSPTANDSHTIGTYAGSSISRGNGYGDRPVTESERFSGSINSKYHEGPSAFFKDGQKVIFTRNNFVGGKAQKSSDGINKLKMYIATAEKDGWGNISELPFNSDEYSTGHPALTPNEDFLFFSSDMPGSVGKTDIFVVKIHENGNWSLPVNLGESVNTKGNEMFPFVDERGNLYFSSDGKPGLGGLDLFFVDIGNLNELFDEPINMDVIGAPINLGTPINSTKDDFGMLTDGLRQSGYFSSNRKRGGDDDDIYKFERKCASPIKSCDLILAVKDLYTDMPLNNAIVTTYTGDVVVSIDTTNGDGNTTLEELIANTDYTFTAEREGYLPNTISFLTKDCESDPSRLEISLNQPQVAEDLDTVLVLLDHAVPTCKLIGKALMINSENPVAGVLVSLSNSCDGVVQTVLTDASGAYEFDVIEGCDYNLDGEKVNFITNGNKVDALSCDNGDVIRDIPMIDKTIGPILLEDINFDYGDCNIKPEAENDLDFLVDLMRKNPDMRILLGSHTDTRGTSEFNQLLSQSRAVSTAEYLFARGISRKRVEFKGFGESSPSKKVCKDCNVEQRHEINRRTEFTIL